MLYGIAFTEFGGPPFDPVSEQIIGWKKGTDGEDETWDSRDKALEANDLGGWTGYVCEYPSGKAVVLPPRCKPHFTPDDIRETVAADEERLFKPWSTGRPEGWKYDTATHDTICLATWLSERLTEMVALGLISDDDRKIQQQLFHRWSRSQTDLFDLTAEVINDAIDGRIARDRTPHRRWG